MWIRCGYSIKILSLAGRQIFRWIQAPSSSHEPLSAKNLVDARVAPMEVMRNVKQRRIHVGHLCASQEPLGINRLLRPYDPMEFPLQLHSAGRPHRPMSQQPACEPERLSPKVELGK